MRGTSCLCVGACHQYCASKSKSAICHSAASAAARPLLPAHWTRYLLAPALLCAAAFINIALALSALCAPMAASPAQPILWRAVLLGSSRPPTSPRGDVDDTGNQPASPLRLASPLAQAQLVYPGPGAVVAAAAGRVGAGVSASAVGASTTAGAHQPFAGMSNHRQGQRAGTSSAPSSRRSSVEAELAPCGSRENSGSLQ